MKIGWLMACKHGRLFLWMACQDHKLQCHQALQAQRCSPMTQNALLQLKCPVHPGHRLVLRCQAHPGHRMLPWCRTHPRLWALWASALSIEWFLLVVVKMGKEHARAARAGRSWHRQTVLLAEVREEVGRDLHLALQVQHLPMLALQWLLCH